MRFSFYDKQGAVGVAVQRDQAWFDLADLKLGFPCGANDVATFDAPLRAAIADKLQGTAATPLDYDALTLLPPISPNARIFCVGLNYADHAEESAMAKPEFPVVFLRTYDSFVGHGQPLVLPARSSAFDYEGEMVAVLGKGGRHISEEDAAACVAGYSVANEGSVRDYQLKRGPQWTMGKNFSRSGGMGPSLVSADELPALGLGLAIATRLNGETVQSSNTRHLIFDVAKVIAYLSEAFVLKAGDVIVTGTPAGVGAVRTPPLFMKEGDVAEVEVEGIGIVRNVVVREGA
ncbi:fumarylacetoacetate hydrolase family protein [uncultured Massilia sp.]|uniref:fumarylacetoacetate hydrolase family protein n=1 Tax=uncultured Massilia sp. TaxID=169973 RepID=UPI00258A4AD8|nr:fumarylacetoacetate hydrolase family protein [uncultured Massilia sp.]